MPATSYFDAWLRRTRKQLGASGRLTQVAAVLASQDGNTTSHWEETLRAMLDGDSPPDIDILTRIDAILAGSPKSASANPHEQLDFL